MISLQVLPGEQVDQANLVLTDGTLFMSVPFTRRRPSSLLEQFHRLDLCLTFNSHEFESEFASDRKLFFSTWFSHDGSLAVQLGALASVENFVEPLILSSTVPFSFDDTLLGLMPRSIVTN